MRVEGPYRILHRRLISGICPPTLFVELPHTKLTQHYQPADPRHNSKLGGRQTREAWWAVHGRATTRLLANRGRDHLLGGGRQESGEGEKRS